MARGYGAWVWRQGACAAPGDVLEGVAGRTFDASFVVRARGEGRGRGFEDAAGRTLVASFCIIETAPDAATICWPALLSVTWLLSVGSGAAAASVPLRGRAVSLPPPHAPLLLLLLSAVRCLSF